MTYVEIGARKWSVQGYYLDKCFTDAIAWAIDSYGRLIYILDASNSVAWKYGLATETRQNNKIPLLNFLQTGRK